MDIVLPICGEVELAEMLGQGWNTSPQYYFLKWLLREELRSTFWVDFLDHDYL